MLMIVSLENLRLGIEWWERQKSAWGTDYVNGEYYEMYSVREGGITEVWWDSTVKRLWAWKAIRGPKPPNKRIEIRARGLVRLSTIESEYRKLSSNLSIEPTFINAKWEDVSPLFQCASEIKPRSQVFASKMCHFLFPNLFMVIDNLATGVFEYEFYWRGMQGEWSRFVQKSEAKEILRKAIKGDKVIHERYPFETKVLELCHIGYQHRDRP